MKKLFLSLGLALGTMFSTNASELIIINHCYTYLCVQMIQTSTVNGVNYAYLNEVPFDSCELLIPGGTVFHLSDGLPGNVQFPFLNVWPFTGNVLQGPGQTANLPIATLPLPPTNNENERFRFQYMKFRLKGGYDDGFGYNGNLGGNGPYSSTGTYHTPPGEPYEMFYVWYSGIHYFEFTDNL